MLKTFLAGNPRVTTVRQQKPFTVPTEGHIGKNCLRASPIENIMNIFMYSSLFKPSPPITSTLEALKILSHHFSHQQQPPYFHNSF